MMQGMIRCLFAALAFIAAPAVAKVCTPPPPATVVVGFDHETITPLIVEGVEDQ